MLATALKGGMIGGSPATARVPLINPPLECRWSGPTGGLTADTTRGAALSRGVHGGPRFTVSRGQPLPVTPQVGGGTAVTAGYGIPCFPRSAAGTQPLPG